MESALDSFLAKAASDRDLFAIPCGARGADGEVSATTWKMRVYKEMLLFLWGWGVMEIRALDFLVDLTGMNLPTES